MYTPLLTYIEQHQHLKLKLPWYFDTLNNVNWFKNVNQNQEPNKL